MSNSAVAGSGGRGTQAHAIPELIAKLEGAAEGSRDLDAAIWATLQPVKIKVVSAHPPYQDTSGRSQVRFTLPPKRTEEVTRTAGPYRHAEPYTTSADAILALIERELPGWIVRLDIRPHDAPGGEASLEAPWDGAHEHLPIWFEARAKTPALAACIAFLKARSADQPRAPQEDRSGRVMNPDLISKEGEEHG